MLHSRKLAKDIPKKHRPVVGRVYTPEFTNNSLVDFPMKAPNPQPNRNLTKKKSLIPDMADTLIVFMAFCFFNLSFHQNLNFVLVFCEQILT